MQVCDACGNEAEPSWYLELEYPVADRALDEAHGQVAGQLCKRCAMSTARNQAAARLIKSDADAPDPSADRVPAARAADGLCEVTLAIESIDYNALMETDLKALMEAFAVVRDMTLNYRSDQHAEERANDE